MNIQMMFNIIIFLKCIHSEIIILPFKKTKSFEGDFYSYIFLNELETEILIGTPFQKINAYIKPEKHHLFITGSKLNGQYNEINSNSYEQNGKIERYFYGEQFKTGFLANESFLFLNNKEVKIKTDKISFLIATSIDNKFNYIDNAQIGLGLYDNSIIKEINLIYQLYERKYIYSYSYYFKFENDDKGKIIIGEVINDNNSEKILNYCRIFSSANTFQIIFDNVTYSNEDISFNNIYAQFNFSFGGFITNEKNKKIFDKFFNPLIENNLCQIEKKGIFSFYSCDKNINVSKIQSIKFYHKGLNYTFELDYHDFFREYNNKYYCTIFFQNEYHVNWIFGQIFLKKYEILIDQDRKILGIYIPISKRKTNFLSWLFVFILFFLIIIMIFLIYRRTKLIPKRIKANELIEEEINEDYLKIIK